MNNANRDNFERIVQLAEFGAKRHDERRQVDTIRHARTAYRVSILYVTCLETSSPGCNCSILFVFFEGNRVALRVDVGDG